MIYIAFLIFTFLILGFAFYQWQHFMIFTPKYHREGYLADNCEILSIMSDDGVALEGVVYEPKEYKSTLLYFGGRSQDTVGLINKLANAFKNTRVITFNYRSYGKSAGVVNEKNVLSDSLFVAEIIQKNYGNFYILGFSLGSNIGAYVASKKDTLGLFLVGSFDSIASLAKEKYSLNISKLFRYKFPTVEYVKNIQAKTYLFVSKSDEVAYIQNARNLKENVKNLVYYEELDNLTHKEILWDSDVIEKINEVLVNDSIL